MILATIDNIPNREYEVLGIVKGNMVQTKNMFKDIFAEFKGLFGGELKTYTEMMNEARQYATKRMVEEAESMGADAILGILYTSSTITSGAAEVIAYGTAIKFLDQEADEQIESDGLF